MFKLGYTVYGVGRHHLGGICSQAMYALGLVPCAAVVDRSKRWLTTHGVERERDTLGLLSAESKLRRKV